MTNSANYILGLLREDIVSHGLLVQSVRQIENAEEQVHSDWIDVLEELLSNSIEIGDAKLASADHVEFIAWTGTVGHRIDRAKSSVASQSGADQEFAYWLCLPEHVDRFEIR